MAKFKHFFLALLALGIPLRAQLDPRLQASKTSFLDLYQQSSTTRVKPEVLTMFDFSRSMASLMCHPLYQNADVNDADDYRYMKFVLTNGSTGAAPNNTYTITAKAGNCTSATATYTVVVNSSGAVGTVGSNPAGCTTSTTTASTYTIYAKAVGNTSAYAYVTFSPTTSGANPSYQVTGSGNTGIKGTYTITHSTGLTTPSPTIEVSASSGPPYTTGTVVTLTTYLTHPFAEGEDATHKQIVWSGGPSSTPAPTEIASGLYKSVVTWTIPSFTPTSANPTQLKPMITSGGTGSSGTVGNTMTFSSGATITLNTYFLTQGTGTGNGTISWSVSAGSGNACSSTPSISPTSTTATTTSGGSVTWTIPSYCSAYGAGSNPYVTVSLDASAPTTSTSSSPYVVSGLTYAGALSATTKDATGYEALRKPDGTAVAYSDVVAQSGFYGGSNGVTDVRNWIRLASHVRFKYKVTGSYYRTIDIPIPWKIMDRTCSGAPVNSVTTKDEEDKTVTGTSGTTTLQYGSQTNIEMDTSYLLEAQNGSVFTSDTNGTFSPNSAQTTVYMYTTLYRPAYISWLFTGKYQSTSTSSPNYVPSTSSLSGKYIVFDAQATSSTYLAAGQTLATWGQGFGPAASTSSWSDKITIPQYNLDGSYKGTATDYAANYIIPGLTRLQAVKKAAITTWISHQADVYWAFRFLDQVNEAGVASGTNAATATTLNYNSSTTISSSSASATTTHANGNDSGWVMLTNSDPDGTGMNATSGNSVKGMTRIAAMFANGDTPLTYAVARGLLQFSDPSSVFNAIEGSNVSQCAKSYLILFTDGIDNNGEEGFNNPFSVTPYLTGSGSTQQFNALTGNQQILASKANVNVPSDIASATPTSVGSSELASTWWNLFTFAGIGAHLGDTSLGSVAGTDHITVLDPSVTPDGSDTPSNLLPYYGIADRNGTTFSKPHLITTMTVGVSLGGQYTDASSPKRSLFLAAVAGDPGTTSGLLSGFHAFNGYDETLAAWNAQTGGDTTQGDNDWVPGDDPNSYPQYGVKRAGAVYFFDATNASKLSTSLDYAIRIAISSGSNNATSSPNLPYVGSTLGKEVYIGRFNVPMVGGVTWPGDLMMFSTRETSGTLNLVDTSGNIITALNASSAAWSAASILTTSTKHWYNRTLYTRLPGTSSMPERGFHSFTDQGTAYSNAQTDSDNTSGLQYYVSTSLGIGSSTQKAVIQKAAGGDTSGTLDANGRPTANRLDIMGDIIDSSPAAIEYNLSDTNITAGITASSQLSLLSNPDHFRLILVGTNQGWLHAFGEVSKDNISVTDSTGTSRYVAQGKVDELWAFMPTDFLSNLSYVYGASAAGNAHRFLVDGTPSIYFLDLPSANGVTNGVVDNGTSSQERAIAIVGLGKGGRSYYAINVRDPFSPVLLWSLVPDEASVFPASRNKSTLATADLQKLIANMGYSTCTPGVGRVTITDSGGNTTLHDVVFLGGGLSLDEVDAAFQSAANDSTIQLGRSVIALDVYTGQVLSAFNMPSGSGPIANGLIPFEFILNSGTAQRAYFMDRLGGLWAWGSKHYYGDGTGETATAYQGFRTDTSELPSWSLRKVYQDGQSGNAKLYSTLSAPFRVGSFPGSAYDSTRVIPAAVGVAMVSGDRNNPLDYPYPGYSLPDHYRLTVVFDRQDSYLWGLDSKTGFGTDTGIQDTDLANFTANAVSSIPSDYCSTNIWKSITPGCSDYFLTKLDPTKPKFGYYVNFPSAGSRFVPKGINAPMVVSGSLFYTYFTPTSADPCTGGNGTSYSNIICNVLEPIVTDTGTGLSCQSGLLYSNWSGVVSDYIAFGTQGVLQGGAVTTTTSAGSVTTPEVKTWSGQGKNAYPKPKVWRTVQ